jgi:glutaryl-CoA dehydrogenase
LKEAEGQVLTTTAQGLAACRKERFLTADIKHRLGQSLGTDFYQIDELLTKEEREIRDKVRAFCDKEVIPIINDYWERAQVPFDLIPKLGALKVAGGSIKGYGCPGMSAIAAGLVLQELSRVDASFCVVFGATSSLAMTSIAMLGSEEQKQRWLQPMARLEKQGCFALTEPDHGSDAVALATGAHRDGDVYVINGAKRWIGGASYADIAIVWARDDKGDVGGFLVEKGTPGFETKVMTSKVAMRASWQADITLTNVRVPVENRLALSRSFKLAC